MSSSVSSSLTMISDIFFLIFCNCVCDKCWRNDNRSLLTGNSWNDWIKQRSLEELKTALFTFWSHLSFLAIHYSTKYVSLAANSKRGRTPVTWKRAMIAQEVEPLDDHYICIFSFFYLNFSNNTRSSICGSKWIVTCCHEVTLLFVVNSFWVWIFSPSCSPCIDAISSNL